jgi:hypothetical protein
LTDPDDNVDLAAAPGYDRAEGFAIERHDLGKKSEFLTEHRLKRTIGVMAKTYVVTDDLDGSSGAQTVSFSVDGRSYELDLAKKNRTAFDKAIKPYVDAARKAPANAVRKPSAQRGRNSSSVDLAAVRAWAAENDIAVSDRGRIAAAVMDAYNAAH